MPISSSKKQTKLDGNRKQKALDLAREKKGKLTYDDLNEVMPEGATAEDIDEMMVMLSGMDIDIVDEFRVDTESQKKQQQREKQLRRAQARREAAQTRLERADDPVRMYLREMGRVPLLTKDQEVAIAKRIEAAEAELIEVILSTPYTVKEVQMLAARILAGRLNFVNITDEEEPRFHHRFVKDLPVFMEQIGDLEAGIEAQEKRLRRSNLSPKSMENIEQRIRECRGQQRDIIREFRLKPREIMKIGRRIKGLKRSA